MQYKRPTTATKYDEKVTTKLDRHIGKLVKRLRLQSGITKTELGLRTGISLQQLNKYEDAENRVSVSRLYWLARALNTSPNYFFDSFASKDTAISGLSDNEQEAFLNDAIDKEKKELVDAYFSIQDTEKRKWHLDHIKQDSLPE